MLAISGRNAIHSLLFLILSLLSISIIFYILGAPFIAALEVIVYAGAIMVLFIFVIMMLNVGMEKETEKKWLSPRMWILPSILALILLFDFIYMVHGSRTAIVQRPDHPSETGRDIAFYNLPARRGDHGDAPACGDCRRLSPGKAEEKGHSSFPCKRKKLKNLTKKQSKEEIMVTVPVEIQIIVCGHALSG